jgi:4-hydroxy-2-oxoheptanedioate aldolase
MNRFRDAIRRGECQWGLWQALASAYTAEISARAGYDWLLIDGEHAPNTAQTLLAQLQAVAPFAAEAIARPPDASAPTLKQYLDLGFRTLLVPMVENAAAAEAIVAATRYPPAGLRGVASAITRASDFGQARSYLATAHEDLCVILQIESRQGLDALEAIAAVPGVDALFIGPGDLAASLGHLGDVAHPAVQAAVDDAIRRGRAAGKPIGIFAGSAADGRRRREQGCSFVSVGTDIGLLVGGARQLLEAARTG